MTNFSFKNHEWNEANKNDWNLFRFFFCKYFYYVKKEKKKKKEETYIHFEWSNYKFQKK